ncbi:hypothetical protein PIB30_037383 [Stylosanthes scabra]|uniref:Uncharacterized protein n=1 Tax=Stylosanthes scabra TaxID=79078 RepID=A0ABU6WH59_9FABA|nr:hypothetical protein [Stylosanthes scabra]
MVVAAGGDRIPHRVVLVRRYGTTLSNRRLVAAREFSSSRLASDLALDRNSDANLFNSNAVFHLPSDLAWIRSDDNILVINDFNVSSLSDGYVVFLNASNPCCKILLCNSTINLSPKSDVELLEFSLNLEYLEAELFLHGATGRGIDDVDLELAQGGLPPIGGNKAVLDEVTRHTYHLAVCLSRSWTFEMLSALLNIRRKYLLMSWIVPLENLYKPPFDPYAGAINFYLLLMLFHFVGLNEYVGVNPEF